MPPMVLSANQQAAVAAYHPRKGALGECDYSQVLQDFGVARHELGHRVLILGAIDLDHDEIEAREGGKLLLDDSPGCSPSGARFTNASARPLQMPNGGCAAPVCVLVPSARAQPNLQAVRMELVLDLIAELSAVGHGSWSDGYAALSRKDIKKANVPFDQSEAGQSTQKGDVLHGTAPERISRYVILRGAKVRSTLLVPFDPARVIRVDELPEAVLELTGIHPSSR
mmetsp:Transcript_43567/g.107788  ORF Transcript_43567/g.107788 Transcript_43567/m.107788 type:complete len:226 (+) Transcript_43567:16-693(+)